MNKLKIAGMLAMLATMVGVPLVSAASCAYGYVSGSGVTICPIVSNGNFANAYVSSQQTAIFTSGAVGDFSAILAANIGNLFWLGILVVLYLKVIAPNLK